MSCYYCSDDDDDGGGSVHLFTTAEISFHEELAMMMVGGDLLSLFFSLNS